MCLVCTSVCPSVTCDMAPRRNVCHGIAEGFPSAQVCLPLADGPWVPGELVDATAWLGQ